MAKAKSQFEHMLDKIASVHPEYELGRMISQEKDLFRVVMDKEECLARVSRKFRYNV